MWGVLHTADPALSLRPGERLGVGVGAMNLVALRPPASPGELRVIGAWLCELPACARAPRRWALATFAVLRDDCALLSMHAVPIQLDTLGSADAVERHIVADFSRAEGDESGDEVVAFFRRLSDEGDR